MTITLFGYRVVIFQIEKLEKFIVEINHEVAINAANEIKNNARFMEIKQQAKIIKANRIQIEG